MTDELKPVRCGCGGEAKVIGHVSRWDAAYRWYVRCASCDISTAEYPTEAEAVQAWNRAMGSTEKSSTVERTAKVIEHDASVTDTARHPIRRTRAEDGKMEQL